MYWKLCSEPSYIIPISCKIFSFFPFVFFLYSAWILRIIHGSIADDEKNQRQQEKEEEERLYPNPSQMKKLMEKDSQEDYFFPSQNPNGTLHMAYEAQGNSCTTDEDFSPPPEKLKKL